MSNSQSSSSTSPLALNLTTSSTGTSNNNNNSNLNSNPPPPQHSSFQYRSLRPTTPSPRDPTIRHAGRAHIRGKIRRVWRPRYLELCDTGLVRYYELPPTADVTLPEDSDWDHVNMIPKDTLVIYHARIIDVTTLRDLHVGLPRGSYGFLFRGQRQCPLELLMNHSNEANPPREYFCAVSTLEEAQTWVIVLQWAASVCKATHQRSLSSNNLNSNDHPHDHHSGGGERSSINFLGDSCHIPSSSHRIPSVVVDRSAMSSGRSPKYNATPSSAHADAKVANNIEDTLFFPDATTTSDGSVGAATTSTTDTLGSPTVMVSRHHHNQQQQQQQPPIKRTTVGRIVVTKVDGYRLVKLPASSPAASLLLLQWQIAYEVGLLLIQGTKVEERQILRTAHDFVRLLDDLSRELDSKISLGLIEEWQSKLLARPLPPTSLNEYYSNKKNTNNNNSKEGSSTSAILPRVAASFAFVDKMLRALAMDANIVNSNALKRCFVLDTDHPSLLPHYRWWKTLSPREFERSLTLRKSRVVPEDDTDTFVKTWLSSKQQPIQQDWTTTSWLWVLQRPWMVLGSAGVGLALSVPLARVYQQVMISVSLRLDVLMGSWCLAAYLGKEYWSTPSGTPADHRSGNQLVNALRSRSTASQPTTRHGATTTTTRSAARLPHSTSVSHQDNNKHLAASTRSSKLDSSTVVVTTPSTGNEHDEMDTSSVDSKDDLDYLEHDVDDDEASVLVSKLSSPLPQYPYNNGESCWSSPSDNSIFRVRGSNYLEDRIKIPSGSSPFQCRGVDVWLTDNPERHIARHPSVLNGKLHEQDTFLVNFLLPFGNFVSYFTVPPLSEFPDTLATVWSKFVKGDQQYRDKRLKLLPVVMDGPWIVKAAVGNGTAPALLGKVIPLQYYFQEPKDGKAVYEVDVIITASSIAKGILSVVKGHTKSLTIAFAFIIEAAEQEELPETVLCAFQVHQLHLEDCPHLPECNLDEI